MSRLATVARPLAELAELIKDIRYNLDHLDVPPAARRWSERATDNALQLVHTVLDAAYDDADAALLEDMLGDDDLEGVTK